MTQPIFSQQRQLFDPRDFLVRLGPAPRIGVVRARPTPAGSEYSSVEIEIGTLPVYILHAAITHTVVATSISAGHIILSGSTTLDGLSGASTAFSFGIGADLTATAREGRTTTKPNGLIVSSLNVNIVTSGIGLASQQFMPLGLPLYVDSGFVAFTTDQVNTDTALSLMWAEVQG